MEKVDSFLQSNDEMMIKFTFSIVHHTLSQHKLVAIVQLFENDD
jgi:hypothetical protein